MSKLQFFPEELQGISEDLVESYGRTDGTLYVVRLFNTDGAPVPPMDAYLVMVGHDGEIIDSTRTNDPEEITAWSNLYR